MSSSTPLDSLPLPLVLLLMAVLMGGAAETYWVFQREIRLVETYAGMPPAEAEVEWHFRGLDARERSRFDQFSISRNEGVREFHWIYPEESATAERNVPRYLTAALLYPRPVYRRTVTDCRKERQAETAPGVINECAG